MATQRAAATGGFGGDFFRKLPPLIGPLLPENKDGGLSASVLAERARHDPMPLREQSGGYYTAERHPDVLFRQFQLLEQFASSGNVGGSLPRWVAVVFGLIAGGVLALAGWSMAPSLLGFGGVQGSGGLMQAVIPYIGAVAGGACGVGGGVFLQRMFGRAPTGDMWPRVYAKARVSQVAYVTPEGYPCEEDDLGAQRFVVRRMRTWLMRMAFADRQQGIFVPTADWKPGMDLFRDGEIRLETTADLSAWSHPSELYSGRPLGCTWRGVNSVRWWVQLNEPIEAGKETAIYDAGPEGQQRNRLIGNAGFWILAAGLLIGLLIFFNAMDSANQSAAPVDRTPGTPGATPAQESTPVSTETGGYWQKFEYLEWRNGYVQDSERTGRPGGGLVRYIDTQTKGEKRGS